MEKTRSLDIIIVNWNSGNYLLNCINSIKTADSENLSVNTIIIDNASTDNSLDLIQGSGALNIIRNKTNKGFAAACNQGINYGSSEYVLFLNPDTALSPTTLTEAVTLMESDQTIWVLGVKHLDIENRILPSCSRFPRLLNYIYEISGLSKIRPSVFKPATLMTDWDHNSPRFVDQTMGAFMLTRRSILKNIGNFDERFFVYYEDMDLSYRIKEKGGKIFYTPDIHIFHKGGGTSHQVKDKRLYYSLSSRILYAKKYFKRTELYVLLFFTFFIEPITRVLYSLIKLDYREVKNIFTAYYYLTLDIRYLCSQ